MQRTILAVTPNLHENHKARHYDLVIDLCDRGFARAAGAMAEHHNDACAKLRHREFDAAFENRARPYHISGHTNDEQIANALVEYDLRADPRIGAAQNDRQSCLSFGHR